MPINVNLNNQNKHWILVVLEKISLVLKNFIYSICRGLMIFIKAIGSFFKKIWKGLAIITASAIVLLIIAVVGVQCYDYHIWNKALSATETMFETQEDVSAKISLAYKIQKEDYFADVRGLCKNEFWRDNICYDNIQERIESLQISTFKFVETLAYEGNAKAQNALGLIYYWIKKDYDKAAYWWNEAVKQNHINAYNNLACAYMSGEGVKQNKRKAVEYFRKGAEGGCDWAQRNYGDLFVEGVEVKVGSHKEEYTTMHFQLDNDYKRSYYTDDGRTVYVKERVIDDYRTILHKDIEKAKFWWKKAAAQGNEVAKERLQKIYE